jgi:bifunctional DNA-binding transcriptional regulator/antitoxin component of YhaV-PrlF toxin-antitoxin module
MAVRQEVDEDKALLEVQKGGRITFTENIREKFDMSKGDVLRVVAGGEEREVECPECGNHFEDGKEKENLIVIQKAVTMFPDEIPKE